MVIVLSHNIGALTMKQYVIAAFFVALASPTLADPVLVRIDEPPAWPLLARLDRPHANDVSEAIERVATPEDRTKHHHHHHRHGRHR